MVKENHRKVFQAGIQMSDKRRRCTPQKSKNNGGFHYNDNIGYLMTLSLSRLYSVRWEDEELELRKAMKNLSKDSRCPGRNSCREPPEYKSRALSVEQPFLY
jgi:hypothetical protein